MIDIATAAKRRETAGYVDARHEEVPKLNENEELAFDSKFECGNLDMAVRVSKSFVRMSYNRWERTNMIYICGQIAIPKGIISGSTFLCATKQSIRFASTL